MSNIINNLRFPIVLFKSKIRKFHVLFHRKCAKNINDMEKS